MIERYVTLYDAATGAPSYSTKLNLPEGVQSDKATEADWEAARLGVEQASGSPCIFGRPAGKKLVQGGVFVDRIDTLDEAKAKAWEAIKAKRAALSLSPFQFQGKAIDNDAESAALIADRAARARDAVAAGEALETLWTTHDNTVLTLDAAQMVALSVARSDYIDGLHETARGLREQLLTSDTIAQVVGIHWQEVADAS